MLEGSYTNCNKKVIAIKKIFPEEQEKYEKREILVGTGVTCYEFLQERK